MKNIVFIPNVKFNGRGGNYHYSIKSWTHWCKKNNCELLVWEDPIHDPNFMTIMWQRYYLFDILKANEIDYDQILMVDADTIVHPDCPNFFNETEHKYCGVMNDGCYEWVLRSLNVYSKNVFNGDWVNPWEYINGGFQIVNKKHKDFFDSVVKFYLDNQKNLYSIQKANGLGTDQTPVNFLIKNSDVELKILPQCYNLHKMATKTLLFLLKSHWWCDTLENMYKSGWVYHFNAMPGNPLNRNTNYWLERCYNELYG